MGNNTSRSTQWAPEIVKKAGPVCGSVQPKWPFKVCNLEPAHDGSHCNERQAATQMIRVWWE